jgi:hypothetical protein
MILEGLVTTCDAAGSMHVAAMGPWIDDAERAAGRIARLSLRPFAGSQTAANLARCAEGVFHVIDDVLLLARVVAGVAAPAPAARPATRVRGWLLDDACVAYEFAIAEADRSTARERLEARVVAEHHGRPFLGFNRAAHAVVEAAILVTRLHLPEAADPGPALRGLEPLVSKTGGPREHEAFAVLCRTAAARWRPDCGASAAAGPRL